MNLGKGDLSPGRPCLCFLLSLTSFLPGREEKMGKLNIERDGRGLAEREDFWLELLTFESGSVGEGAFEMCKHEPCAGFSSLLFTEWW